VTKQRIDRK